MFFAICSHAYITSIIGIAAGRIVFLKNEERKFLDIEQNICHSVVRINHLQCSRSNYHRVQLRASRRSGRPRRLLRQVRGQPVRHLLVRVSGIHRALVNDPDPETSGQINCSKSAGENFFIAILNKFYLLEYCE